MKYRNFFLPLAAFFAIGLACPFIGATDDSENEKPNVNSKGSQLKPPVRLKADGKPIDIGILSRIAHAGPWIADVDCDGDRDLLVGDFPGYFWFFENTNNDKSPKYTSKGKLSAGKTFAKTPVY